MNNKSKEIVSKEITFLLNFQRADLSGATIQEGVGYRSAGRSNSPLSLGKRTPQTVITITR